MAADNVSLGRFFLEGIPPAPRGVPKIEVTFTIDVNGILQVSAKDLATGKQQAVTIQSSRLSEAEIERMRKEAELYEAEDRKKKELAEAKNEADSLIYNTRKLLKDLGEKVSEGERQRIEAEIDRLSRAVSEGKLEEIRSASEVLTKSLHELSSRLYSQAGGQAGGGPYSAPGGSAPGSPGSVDARYSEGPSDRPSA